jgi:hypothetical protein
MLATSIILIGQAAAFSLSPARTATRGQHLRASKELEDLATGLNPVIKYYDPLDLAGFDFWDQGSAATEGFLREAEIKHGRVAMAAFVGYCVHANHIEFPWKHLGTGAVDMSSMTAPEQWDAIPEAAKWQIIGLVGFLEIWREGSSDKHYMNGGMPGYYPPFSNTWGNGLWREEDYEARFTVPHPVPLNLYDPLGFSKNKSEEKKARGRLAEINNGRLAMLGVFAFLSESKIPGAVPILNAKGWVGPYTGDYMIPFEGNFHIGA